MQDNKQPMGSMLLPDYMSKKITNESITMVPKAV